MLVLGFVSVSFSGLVACPVMPFCLVNTLVDRNGYFHRLLYAIQIISFPFMATTI